MESVSIEQSDECRWRNSLFFATPGCLLATAASTWRCHSCCGASLSRRRTRRPHCPLPCGPSCSPTLASILSRACIDWTPAQQYLRQKKGLSYLKVAILQKKGLKWITSTSIQWMFMLLLQRIISNGIQSIQNACLQDIWVQLLLKWTIFFIHIDEMDQQQQFDSPLIVAAKIVILHMYKRQKLDFIQTSDFRTCDADLWIYQF